MEFVSRHAPGRAIDFGCGTGTNAITLARHGWQVTAVDFSVKALWTARRKARAAGVGIRFLRRDVTRLEDLEGEFDFGLDLGCFHSLARDRRADFVAGAARLLRPGATLMLYTFLVPDDHWPDEVEVRARFDPRFDLVRSELGDFNGRPSGWFTWIRRP
jgi:cyclopropane fatty-acyl-phospholipid synthase-like methyltransferase